ncbi:hypothetical protein O0I10_013308, partial [Lichtheimia ornata]
MADDTGSNPHSPTVSARPLSPNVSHQDRQRPGSDERHVSTSQHHQAAPSVFRTQAPRATPGTPGRRPQDQIPLPEENIPSLASMSVDPQFYDENEIRAFYTH